GVKLSGGQKQRLAIARMFLKNPPILILDEATSALDTETEVAIQKSLEELTEGRTTLVIAHRLATIKNADRIMVVTKDGIAEQGNHQELIESSGIYSRLHKAQFG
ncbi:ATP-binding cassette domain-containing protein, partial [Staphylococcus sp. SIMBA_130]